MIITIQIWTRIIKKQSLGRWFAWNNTERGKKQVKNWIYCWLCASNCMTKVSLFLAGWRYVLLVMARQLGRRVRTALEAAAWAKDFRWLFLWARTYLALEDSRNWTGFTSSNRQQQPSWLTNVFSNDMASQVLEPMWLVDDSKFERGRLARRWADFP